MKMVLNKLREKRMEITAKDSLRVDSDEEDRDIDWSQMMLAPSSVEYQSHIGKLPVEYDNEIRKFTSKFSIEMKKI